MCCDGLEVAVSVHLDRLQKSLVFHCIPVARLPLEFVLFNLLMLVLHLLAQVAPAYQRLKRNQLCRHFMQTTFEFQILRSHLYESIDAGFLFPAFQEETKVVAGGGFLRRRADGAAAFT